MRICWSFSWPFRRESGGAFMFTSYLDFGPFSRLKMQLEDRSRNFFITVIYAFFKILKQDRRWWIVNCKLLSCWYHTQRLESKAFTKSDYLSRKRTTLYTRSILFSGFFLHLMLPYCFVFYRKATSKILVLGCLTFKPQMMQLTNSVRQLILHHW